MKVVPFGRSTMRKIACSLTAAILRRIKRPLLVTRFVPQVTFTKYSTGIIQFLSVLACPSADVSCVAADKSNVIGTLNVSHCASKIIDQNIHPDLTHLQNAKAPNLHFFSILQ